MAVSGPEGSGKSTLAVKLGIAMDEGYTENWQNWVDQNIIVNPDVEKIQEKILHTLPKYSYINVDEGMRVGYKRDFASFEGRFMAKLLSVSRKCQKIVSICIPNFKDLDSYYRNHRIKLWWFVPERGRCVVFKPSPSPFCVEPWNIQENERLFRKALGGKAYADFSTEEMITAFRKTKNYVMDFEFGKMPSHVEERYLKNVEELRKEMDYKKEKESKEKAKKDKYQGLYQEMRGNFAGLVRFLSQKELMSYSDVGEITNRGKDYVKNVLASEWEHHQKKRRKEQVDSIKAL